MATHTFTLDFKVDDVLTDPTSVVLEDNADVYGIKRNDTDEVIVAAGTATTNNATGRYSYAASGLVEGITYSCYFKVVYSGRTYYFEREYTVPAASSTLCTRTEVINSGNISGSADNSRIDVLILAAAMTINNKYEREFVGHTDATARLFKVFPDSNSGLVPIRHDPVDLTPYDLRSASSVILHPEADTSTTLTVTDEYTLEPLGAERLTSTYTKIQLSNLLSLKDSDFFSRYGYAQLQITGNWGVWSGAGSVAVDVNRAAIITVLSWLDHGISETAAADLLGDPRQVAPSTGIGWAIPPAARILLRPYMRTTGIF